MLLTACSSCAHADLNFAKGETCFASIEKFGLLICENSLTKKEYSRDLGWDQRREVQSADVCTNPDDYFKMRQDYLETKRKYAICKKSPTKCF